MQPDQPSALASQPALAQIQAEHPGWQCWAGLSGACYALHLAALHAIPAPPCGTIYLIKASDPTDLRRQLRNPQFPPAPRPVSAPTPESDPLLTQELLLRTISCLTKLAALNNELDESEGTGTLPVSTDHLLALSHLAGLGAELHQRGYLTYLNMTPPAFLMIGHPQARQPQCIYAEGDSFCWGDDHVPFHDRWIDPVAEAADAVEVITNLAIAYEHEAADKQGPR
jgi:hypothetical protein